MFAKSFAFFAIAVTAVLAGPADFTVPAEKDPTANKTLVLLGDVKDNAQELVKAGIDDLSTAFKKLTEGEKSQDVLQEAGSKILNEVSKFKKETEERVEKDKKFFEEKFEEAFKNISAKTEEFVKTFGQGTKE